MNNPAAYFDILSLGQRMSDLVEGFSRPEIHLFAYAACLLSLYEGQPASEWGYEFVSTPNGLPFSQEINESLELALDLGQLHLNNTLIVLSPDGKAEADILRGLHGNQQRERFLEGAADCLLVFNPGNVREAFNYDTALSYLRNGNHTDWILTKPVIDRLYANFHELRKALACDTRDLSVPLVSWMQYLIETGRNTPHASRPI